MFAGHDTTTATASFGLNFIIENPEILRKCREECNTVFGVGSTKKCCRIENG